MTKVAMITGATGGIGSAVAKRFHAKGFKLVLVDFNREKLEELASDFPGASIEVLDQRDNAAVSDFCHRVIEHGSFIDVAVINAGMLVIGYLADISQNAMLDQLQVNLISTAMLVQSFARRMGTEGRGHLMATVSMGGIVSLKGSATYAASKFGIRGLLWGLKDELGAKGVHVTGIYPAGVDTPMLRHEATHGGSALNFVGIPVTADDVAKAYEKALDRPKLEIYVPYSESISGRFAGAFPWIMTRLYPLLEKIGEARRRKYLKRIGLT
jgi:short-subunit dehydrogenase